MTNVQPGDTAVVIRVHRPDYAWLVGHFVGIDERCTCAPPSMVVWRLDKDVIGPQGQRIGCIPDKDLQRIGPSGAHPKGKQQPREEEVTA